MSRIEQATKAEFYAWQEVCRILQSGGIVTEADLKAPQGQSDTYGQILFNALRDWGKAKQDLGGAREEKSKNGASQLSIL